ncbi:hypothetical protein BVRB_9g203910 [Beta vulgaris subsp. vulgaris]|nr:hypothetical protein BVRB_9g203910 [Beta vulgaris subsp. vulgaris]
MSLSALKINHTFTNLHYHTLSIQKKNVAKHKFAMFTMVLIIHEVELELNSFGR